jgi:hypothetical protein
MCEDFCNENEPDLDTCVSSCTDACYFRYEEVACAAYRVAGRE